MYSVEQQYMYCTCTWRTCEAADDDGGEDSDDEHDEQQRRDDRALPIQRAARLLLVLLETSLVTLHQIDDTIITSLHAEHASNNFVRKPCEARLQAA